ncbi:MAG: methyl-accepting chemotaxis protein [Nostocaceae cyanobacterium]|nr:methyl-accepting chemotaxis protein [Nostocaceae cyanobacterium]
MLKITKASNSSDESGNQESTNINSAPINENNGVGKSDKFPTASRGDRLVSSTDKKSILGWFYNLPISRKQLIALTATQAVSILGLGIGSTLIIDYGLRTQLLQQAKSEVVVTDINYNIKVNQMGFGFRGQSDNSAIVKAAGLNSANQPISAELETEIQKILQNEITSRQIEYATLVGLDGKIIVNANSNRKGEVFDPNGLVKEVIKNRRQIKANAVVKWEEIQKESSPLPPGVINQDALIRYTVTPVMSRSGNEVIGVLISGDIVNGKQPIVQQTLKAADGGYSAVYFQKEPGNFALATSLLQAEGIELDKSIPNVELPNKSLLEKVAKVPVGTTVTERIKIGKDTYTMAAKAVPNKIIEEENGSQLVKTGDPVAILVRGTTENYLNSLLLQSTLEQILAVIVATGLLVILGMILRRSITKPLENLEQTTQKFASGDRTSRAEVFYADEIGQLAATFNNMADRMSEQSSRQESEAKLAQLLNQITFRVRETLNRQKILKAAVNSTREGIQANRVLVCLFDEHNQAKIVAEDVDYYCPSALGLILKDSDFSPDYAQEYEIGMVKAIDDIKRANLSEDELSLLQKLTVKASLVAPIFLDKKLHGLFVAHQCSQPRQWEELEINLFGQVATQIGFALEQAHLLEEVEQARQSAENVSLEQRQQKEKLQMQLLNLLEDVEGASRGDLTVRAEVSAGEIGTVADFFNSIVESLRAIVTQVKKSASQVNAAIGENQDSIRQLADEALRQAAEINRTLDTVDQMTLSIQSVAASAQKAATVAHSVAHTASASGEAMDRSVQKILQLRETVGDTAKKVKRLGESSQEITRVVALINQIASQTNLLAINAGIEAARAGEEGQGFAVVAEEVGELAARAATATKEIEQLVENIQRETNELVQAMETGTSQVVEGTRVVEDAKHSLADILDVSRQIDTLVQSISQAAASQVETSQSVTQLMKDIAKVSELTSDSSHRVSESLQTTVNISQELQETVATFKVS